MKYLLFSRRDVILSYRNLNTFAEGHFLKEPYIFRKAILTAYSRHLNEASERRKKKDLLFEELKSEATSLNLSRSEETEEEIIQSGYTAREENCPEAYLAEIIGHNQDVHQ